ncbi:MAG: hypothetical protein EZS28_048322, partial [Streblomastix strix]
FPVIVCTVVAVLFPDLRELSRIRASVALVGCCVSAVFCASPNLQLVQRVVQLLSVALLTITPRKKSICDVSCPDSPAKSTRAAVIAFGSTSSGVVIVQSGSSESISTFWRNVFTKVGCGCAATCSGFCGYKFAWFGVQYESLFVSRFLVKLVQRVILSFAVLKIATPLQTLFEEWPEESLRIVDGNHSIKVKLLNKIYTLPNCQNLNQSISFTIYQGKLSTSDNLDGALIIAKETDVEFGSDEKIPEFTAPLVLDIIGGTLTVDSGIFKGDHPTDALIKTS